MKGHENHCICSPGTCKDNLSLYNFIYDNTIWSQIIFKLIAKDNVQDENTNSERDKEPVQCRKKIQTK